ncbi:MAG: hypothetical protein AB8H47_10440 [Bacteroidia bacterium]
MKEQYQALLADFAAGTLDESEQECLESLIVEGEIELADLPDFSALMDKGMNHQEQAEETHNMDERFYAMLETEMEQVEKTKVRAFSWPLQLVAAIALILFSFWGGLEYASSGDGPSRTLGSNQQVVELLAANDIDEKIHLVSKVRAAGQADEKMIDALLFMLVNEESNNIRIACVNVLTDYSHLPQARLGLVNAISYQRSTVVLVSIAEALEASGKKMSLEEFSQHLNPQIPAAKKESLKRILAQL